MPINLTEYNLEQTAGIVAKHIDQASKTDQIRSLAKQLKTPQQAYNWLKNNIRYRKEQKDTLYSIERILQRKTADCEDLTLLAGSILSAMGYPTYIKIISDGTNYHIYPLFKNKQGWRRFDLTPRKKLSVKDIQKEFRTVVSGYSSNLKKTGQVSANNQDEGWLEDINIKKELTKAIFTGFGLAVGNLIFDKIKKQHG